MSFYAGMVFFFSSLADTRVANRLCLLVVSGAFGYADDLAFGIT